MDRFDDLLIKARAEMMGKPQHRDAISKEDAFDMACDLTKRYSRQAQSYREASQKAAEKRAAKEAKAKARAERPGFFGRMKQSFRDAQAQKQPGYTSTAPISQTPDVPMQESSERGGPVSDSMPMRERLGLDRTMNDRLTDVDTGQASGQPPSMYDRLMRPIPEDFSTETPAGDSSQTMETSRASSSPPTLDPQREMPSPPQSMGVSDRARTEGGPSQQQLLDAFETLNPERGTRENYASATRRQPARPQEPEGRAINEFFEPGQAGSPQTPTQAPSAETLEESQRLIDPDPSLRRNLHGRPIPERKPQGIVGTGTKGAPKIEDLPGRKETSPRPLEPKEVPMRVPEERRLPESTGATSQRVPRSKARSPITMRQPRSDVKEKNLPSAQRRKMKKNRNKGLDPKEVPMRKPKQEAPKVQEQVEPKQPKQEPPKVEEQVEAKPKPEATIPAAQERKSKRKARRGKPPAVEEKVEAKPKKATPKVKEKVEAKPKGQGHIFGGAAKTKPKAKKEAPKVEAKEEKLPSISSFTDSSVINELMDRAEEGDEAARKHLYNSMGDLEDHHPSAAERYKDTFENMVQDANLSLLPSGMRNNILKEQSSDVNYSLLPNGWV